MNKYFGIEEEDTGDDNGETATPVEVQTVQ